MQVHKWCYLVSFFYWFTEWVLKYMQERNLTDKCTSHIQFPLRPLSSYMYYGTRSLSKSLLHFANSGNFLTVPVLLIQILALREGNLWQCPMTRESKCNTFKRIQYYASKNNFFFKMRYMIDVQIINKNTCGIFLVTPSRTSFFSSSKMLDTVAFGSSY